MCFIITSIGAISASEYAELKFSAPRVLMPGVSTEVIEHSRTGKYPRKEYFDLKVPYAYGLKARKLDRGKARAEKFEALRHMADFLSPFVTWEE